MKHKSRSNKSGRSGSDAGLSERLSKRNERRIVRIPKHLINPDAIIVDLVYIDTTFSRTNNASPFLSYRMRMNSIYDPDPALGSGAIPGYTMWSNQYTSYRVLKFSYDVEVINKEAFPIDVISCPTITDVGLNYASSSDLLGNPYANSHALSMLGGMDRCKFRGSIDQGQFSGSANQYLGDDAYGSGVGTNPSSMLFFNIAAVSSVNFTTAGIFTKGKYTYTTLFTRRAVQTT